MKGFLILCIYMCSGFTLLGQHYNAFSGVDQKTLRIPVGETYSTTAIAGYIQSNFKTGIEKISAIYTWVISNVRYDNDSMYYINWTLYNEEKIAATLRRRKGVCENYAALFTDIALKCGFQSFVVSGYTKQLGGGNKAGHSWCAINLEQEWFLCDPTWDKDASGHTDYFLIPPARFIESHMPFDPLWQLLEYPVTEQEFYRGYSKGNHARRNVDDSVKAFLQQDSLQQLQSSAGRIVQAGIANERVKQWLAFNQMKVAVIYGEKDMNLYNDAVASLNKANIVFNEFVQYRNNGFIPARPDAEISSLLDPIAVLLTAARKKLGELDKSVENFQYDTGTINNRLYNLEQRVQEQQHFLKRYFAVSIAERKKLFYK